MFVVNNILFVVILNIIAKNKIDIFSTNSLYTNTSLVAILELSMGLFIIWVLALITVYVTNVICDRLSHKKVYNAEVEENIIFNPVLEVNNDMVTNNSVSTDNVLVEVINSSKEEDSNNEIETVSQEVYNIIQDSVAIEEHIPVEETLVNYSNSDSNVTFSDVLNGSIPVTYYDNNVANEEYNLIDPQVIYEDKYNKIKNENIVFNNIEIDLEKDTERDNNKVIFNDVNISLNHDVKEEMDLSVEEATLKVKDRVKEERLIVNTISLNDLIDKEEDNKINTVDNSVDNVEVKIEKQNMSVYTIDDYKKIIKMLNELKMHSNDANINIDDAVAISLISNYSIEDCMKFKNILENNLI